MPANSAPSRRFSHSPVSLTSQIAAPKPLWQGKYGTTRRPSTIPGPCSGIPKPWSVRNIWFEKKKKSTKQNHLNLRSLCESFFCVWKVWKCTYISRGFGIFKHREVKFTIMKAHWSSDVVLVLTKHRGIRKIPCPWRPCGGASCVLSLVCLSFLFP